MLKISHIVKNFENINALQNVSLDIEKGEFFGLLGPNGAGKSTLMNIIIAYLVPNSGEVTIGREAISSQNIGLRKKMDTFPRKFHSILN